MSLKHNKDVGIIVTTKVVALVLNYVMITDGGMNIISGVQSLKR